ncbi:MAG: hypothetical protein AUI14_08750 [Actinobacteria bacterium 13_2_20CM_2_71_6]|nr:MAG: hypothetical protein AUI14_08750 [Actinobacteria bacterium 13_2_20CM_2_71_6]
MVHSPDREDDIEYDIAADLLSDGAVVLVVSPYQRPRRHAAAFAERISADDAFTLARHPVDGTYLEPLAFQN